MAIFHGNVLGDPRKATDRVVDMVRSEGDAEGKRIPARFPLGADAVGIIRDSCSKNEGLRRMGNFHQ